MFSRKSSSIILLQKFFTKILLQKLFLNNFSPENLAQKYWSTNSSPKFIPENFCVQKFFPKNSLQNSSPTFFFLKKSSPKKFQKKAAFPPGLHQSRGKKKLGACPCTRQSRMVMMIARYSPPQTPPPSRSHPRHRPFGALVSARDGGESGVGAGWNSSSHYGIRSGEWW